MQLLMLGPVFLESIPSSSCRRLEEPRPRIVATGAGQSFAHCGGADLASFSLNEAFDDAQMVVDGLSLAEYPDPGGTSAPVRSAA